MKKLKYLLTVVLLFFSLGVFAQDGLNIESVFQYYAKRHGSTLVQLSADVLRAYEMTLYKSLSFRPDNAGNYSLERIVGYIDLDKRRAKKIKETLLDGNLQSGYYQLPQVKKGVNRFILFKVNAKRRATLIYIEGTLSSAELVSMLFSKK